MVGGGPSLGDFPWGMLQGELTIALNASARYVDRPTISLSSDYRFQNSLEPRERLDFLERSGMVLYHDLGPISGLERTPHFKGFHIVRSSGRRVWSEDLEKGLIHGTHTGAAALNLAYLLGANPIYLLGFDYLAAKDGKTCHFHSDYPESWRDGAYSSYGTFSSEIERLAPNLQARRVYNVNRPGMSALKCFPLMWHGDIPAAPRRPLYLTMATAGAYMRQAEGLRDSAKLFGLDVWIRSINDRGTWKDNVCQKPQVIREALAMGHTEVCWVDADARFRRYPSLLDSLSAHVGGHWLQRAPNREKQLCGGTLYFRGDEGLRTVGRWIKALEEHPDPIYGDLAALEVAWREAKGARCMDLGPEYCWIYDTMPRLHPRKRPVIEHLQASRENK